MINLDEAIELAKELEDANGDQMIKLQQIKEFTENAAGGMAEVLGADHPDVQRFAGANTQCETLEAQIAAIAVEFESLVEQLGEMAE